MDSVRFAENLGRFRKEKKITQEQLAEFCGVTKASVSKWETGQTLPDVLLLPRIATFFGVSIDKLLGYEMYLTKEQINAIYEELATDFATKDFDDAMAKCREYIRQYYSCYEFLEKVILLWIAHDMWAGAKKNAMLSEAKQLCQHILENCRNISLCGDVIFLQSIIDLQLGYPTETVEALEETNNPLRLAVQADEVLLSAYIESGMTDKGNDFAQVSMYIHLMLLLSVAYRFAVLNKDNLAKCKETQYRVDELIRIYNLERLNFNNVTLYIYQMAEIYAYHGQQELAVEQLNRYVDILERVLKGELRYHQGDDYMDRLVKWFEGSVYSGGFPRDNRVIYDGMVQTLEAESFKCLKDYEPFLELKKRVKNIDKFVSEVVI